MSQGVPQHHRFDLFQATEREDYFRTRTRDSFSFRVPEVAHGGMGGKEAIGRLQQLDPEAKAVVCSGFSNDPIMGNFRTYGFRGAILKPFDADELNTLLLEVIHS